MGNPALISRTVVDMNDGNYLITERWDHMHPQCPFVVSSHNPYVSQLQSGIIQKIEPKE